VRRWPRRRQVRASCVADCVRRDLGRLRTNHAIRFLFRRGSPRASEDTGRQIRLKPLHVNAPPRAGRDRGAARPPPSCPARETPQTEKPGRTPLIARRRLFRQAVPAPSTPMIGRCPDSRRHQLAGDSSISHGWAVYASCTGRTSGRVKLAKMTGLSLRHSYEAGRQTGAHRLPALRPHQTVHAGRRGATDVAHLSRPGHSRHRARDPG